MKQKVLYKSNTAEERLLDDNVAESPHESPIGNIETDSVAFGNRMMILLFLIHLAMSLEERIITGSPVLKFPQKELLRTHMLLVPQHS